MADIETLIKEASVYIPPDKLEFIRSAYEFAAKAHAGQLRASGEPYLEHPLNVGLTLVEYQLDAEAIAAALLHDVVEDCDVTLDEIASRFGSGVAKLVDGVTKLKRLASRSEEGEIDSRTQAENLRKLLMATAEDLRVVLIKLADRLHNMRTLGALPLGKRRAIARQTLDVYAPLAHRLGLRRTKWQLEDLAFRYLEPKQYRRFTRLIATKRAERDGFIEDAIRALSDELKNAGMEARVLGRPKHIYSTYLKAIRYAEQGKSVGDIHDLFALRVLVNTVSDCYRALGVVHNFWHPIIEEFNDYIANPKENGYQSLHTTVLCNGTTPIEIQIRTHEMNQVATFGVAAHWDYKEGGKHDHSMDARIAWLQDLAERRDEMDGEDFVASLKSDVLTDQVFVYTPKGEIKDLPKGATPLDFAFRIHTDLGYRCIGAKVNGKLVQLNQPLNNGDVIEIVSSKTERGPSLDWLNLELGYVRTSHAQSKVRQWFNKQERSQSIELGRQMLETGLKRLGVVLPGADKLATKLGYSSPDELYLAVGRGNLTVSQAAVKLNAELEAPEKMIEVSAPKRTSPGAVRVLGVGNLYTRMASCCNPLPGEDIIGYITQGRGVTVHRRDCINVVNETERERLVAVDWGDVEQVYPVKLQIDAWDRSALLRDISAVIAEAGVNITDVGFARQEGGVASLRIDVEVTSTSQLSRLMGKIQSLWGVINVVRKGESIVREQVSK
ncbi:MAG: bifunctional (p)ppGpp synthetase/guanosine-3',5'-bis(diphosphate) 3'-pyrophosphohydrolase [Dehalococcoidia bacterium]|nr:bifunctional (p)ppGpp synthetase/guanosine-3',5'-bis(diphosphate) 3'-pyrophosphohydrolase [Dehalococcoidia bacterium]